jgi:branched-chain amino acid transport system permease protein
VNERIATTEAVRAPAIIQHAGSPRDGFRSRKFQIIGYSLLLIAGLIAPFIGYPVFLMKALCFALFACAFNLLLGYTGLLSFGHAAFFSTAAYVTGYLIKVKGFTPGFGILAGTLVATLLGIVIGALVIRRQGIYFAMITLALAQLVYFVFLRTPLFTGGEDGLQGIPRGRLLWVINLENDRTLYYVVFAIFVFGFLLIRRTIHSPFGQVLKAIRENEPRALSLGYDVNKYKLVAFILSAGLAGLAGATKALVFGSATLTDAEWHASGEVVLMTLLGGMGTVFGPIVGAFSIVTLQNKLADTAGSFVMVIIGAIFIVCVLLFRRGIVGEVIALYEREVGKNKRGRSG